MKQEERVFSTSLFLFFFVPCRKAIDKTELLCNYLLPINKQAIPINTKIKSIALERRFFSLNIIAPKRKETITLPLRTIDTTAIIAPGHDKA